MEIVGCAHDLIAMVHCHSAGLQLILSQLQKQLLLRSLIVRLELFLFLAIYVILLMMCYCYNLFFYKVFSHKHIAAYFGCNLNFLFSVISVLSMLVLPQHVRRVLHLLVLFELPLPISCSSYCSYS